MKMKATIVLTYLVTVFIGMCLGYFGRGYWDNENDYIQSMAASIKSHDAISENEYETALEQACLALSLNDESIIAEEQLKDAISAIRRQNKRSCD